MDITITPYQTNDVNELYALIIDSADHLRPWMPWLHSHYSISDTRQWVELCIDAWDQGQAFRYVIRSIDGAILGTVGLDQIDRAHKTGELGYWVGSNTLNQGIATQACLRAAKAAFQCHGLQRIQINILTDNEPSNRVAKKVGAVFEGTLRNKLFHNGQSHLANAYSLIPSDLEID